ncbi:hypothetical protein AAC387_Pa04g2911 [Persea americana]
MMLGTKDGWLPRRSHYFHHSAPHEITRNISLQSDTLVYYNGQFHSVSDRFRHFSNTFLRLVNPIGSVLDKLLIGRKRIQVVTRFDEEIHSVDEVPIIKLSRIRLILQG